VDRVNYELKTTCQGLCAGQLMAAGCTWMRSRFQPEAARRLAESPRQVVFQLQFR